MKLYPHANTLPGKITELQLGGVMAHVVVQVGDNFIESVITECAEHLGQHHAYARTHVR